MQQIKLSSTDIANLIDHTLLKANAKTDDFVKLCQEADQYLFKAICVPLSWIEFCQKNLNQKKILIATVIGFPLGNQSAEAKFFEIDYALNKGAHELDIVFDIGRFLSGQIKNVEAELKKCRDLTPNHVIKVIVESGILTETQIELATKLVLNTGANFIKTSTGFASQGATPQAVSIMKAAANGKLLIKASGGIKTIVQFMEYFNLGVNRIGCSQSVEIIQSNEAKA